MDYDRKTILGLKFRAASTLRRLSRQEFFGRLQLLRVLDPIVDEAYKQVEQETWANQTDDSPHGHPWHVSFHGSQFPGDDAMACPRASLYRMMDFAPEKPFNRHSRAVMSAGKAIEMELVRVWEAAGILLSASAGDAVQTGYEDPETWLTASVDAILLPPRWNKPLPVEIKSKYKKDLDEMLVGMRGPDEAHVKQLKVEIAFTRIIQQELAPGLDLADHGYIYYLSRDRPSVNAEYRVDYDERFWEAGLARLKEWKGYYLEDVLPSIDSSKKHPMGWRWTYLPCRWCDFGQICRKDFKEGVTQLSASTGIEASQKIRAHYDPAKARQRVQDRWAKKSKISPRDRDEAKA